MTNAIRQGKSYAGNPHVWFDERAVASAKPRCGALRYKIVRIVTFAITIVTCSMAFSAQRIESISGNFDPYLNTGYFPKPKQTIIEMCFDPRYDNQNMNFFCSRKAQYYSETMYGVNWSSSTKKFSCVYGSKTEYESEAYPLFAGKKYILRYQNNLGWIKEEGDNDFTLIINQPLDSSFISTEAPLVLFAACFGYTPASETQKESFTVTQRSAQTLHYLKIFEVDETTGQENLVRNYVPAKDDNGVKTLCETISGTFLEVLSLAGKSFVAGADVPLQGRVIVANDGKTEGTLNPPVGEYDFATGDTQVFDAQDSDEGMSGLVSTCLGYKIQKSQDGGLLWSAAETFWDTRSYSHVQSGTEQTQLTWLWKTEWLWPSASLKVKSISGRELTFDINVSTLGSRVSEADVVIELFEDSARTRKVAERKIFTCVEPGERVGSIEAPGWNRSYYACVKTCSGETLYSRSESVMAVVGGMPVVSYWKFDGETIDSQLADAVGGNTLQFKEGAQGVSFDCGVMRFLGVGTSPLKSSKGIVFPNPTAGGTFEMWIRQKQRGEAIVFSGLGMGLSAWRFLWCAELTSGGGVRGGFSKTDWPSAVQCSSTDNYGQNFLGDKKWHHIALILDPNAATAGQKVYVYVDGIRSTEDATKGFAGDIWDATAIESNWALNFGTGSFELADLRVTNSPLTPSDFLSAPTVKKRGLAVILR